MTQELALLKSLLQDASPSEVNEAIEALTPEEAEALLYDWDLWARDNQLPPTGVWQYWLCLAGRGWGKTRTGGEWIRRREKEGARRIALVGRTAADVRDTMILGESGLLACYPESERPRYMESKRRVIWKSGAIATCYSADTPDQLRGPQHDTAWADELASWKYPESWDQLLFGLRLGKDPRVVITTTPRPIPIIKKIIAKEGTVVVRGSTFENKANLAETFIDAIVSEYEGTRLGRQELYAEILDDNPRALWKRNDIDKHRVDVPPPLKRVVVAIDPAATSKADSDETGIVVAGVSKDDQFYVLEDASGRYTPDQWAREAIRLYRKYNADRIIGESNNGGEMIEAVLRNVDKNVSYKSVHASRGKVTRAEPIAALYEQGRAHHVGNISQLEDQMCEWEPGMDSPDRMDAAVWAITELTGTKKVVIKNKESLGLY